jgi:hypothetical protein
VMAGIVGNPKDYRWSSYSVYAYGRKDLPVDEHPIYQELSTKGVLKARNAMKGEMDRRMIYGNKDFIDVIKRGYELEALVKPKGRPKKEEKK